MGQAQRAHRYKRDSKWWARRVHPFSQDGSSLANAPLPTLRPGLAAKTLGSSFRRHSGARREPPIFPRHCEAQRAEAVQSDALDSGLLRFARNDGEHHMHSPSRGAWRPSDAAASPLDYERAQGRPGACRPHGPPAEKKAGGSHHRFGQDIPALPARVVYGLYALSSGTGFIAPVIARRNASRVRDNACALRRASAPGCQDHTTSPSAPACARLAQPSRPSQPASTYRDDAYAPCR
jgi:hypothetical protein